MSQPSHQIFTTDFKTRPYWLDHIDSSQAVSRDIDRVSSTGVDLLPASPRKLPTHADVVVLGSGYTGLHAALPLARAGRHVVVLEAEGVGHGCSSRNGGQISTAIKPGLARLTRRHGRDAALQLHREGIDSVDWLDGFITREAINCQYVRCGSFHGAHTPGQFQMMQQHLHQEPPELRTGAWLIEPDAMAAEIGTSRYFGGAVYPQDGSLQPALYHQGLLHLALTAGVEIHTQTRALSLHPSKQEVRVSTSRGDITATDVVVATNGYTGSATPELQRRVIPVGSYMIATEPLSSEVMNSVLPTDRIICDTRKVIYYYRPSPDRTRVVFGGRVSAGEVAPEVSAPRLLNALTELFPQLEGVRVSHSWLGYVAFTFDDLAHIGREDHVHHALGYCGSGIAMSSYFGARIGHQLAGTAHAADYLDRAPAIRPELPFRTRPFYSGNPWFLSAAIRYYRWRDRLAH